MVNLHEEIRSNKIRSSVILIVFSVFSLIIFGFALLGIILSFFSSGNILNFDYLLKTFLISEVIVFGFLVVYLFYFLNSGDKMILSVTGAKQADRKNYPHLFHSVESLTISAGMKSTPSCYIIDDSALNAYATGFKEENSYIVVTTGLINKLNREELEGVLAHEISHIKNQDIKIMLYVAGLIGVFTLLSTFFYYAMITQFNSQNEEKGAFPIIVVLWLIFTLIAPFFALLLKLAISRQREYLADSSGALLTRYPEGLASALTKISTDPDPLVDKANKATAHLFISTPFRKKKSIFKFFSNLFSTHPPIEKRIARLRGKDA